MSAWYSGRKLPALVADGSTQHPDIHAIGKVSTSCQRHVLLCSYYSVGTHSGDWRRLHSHWIWCHHHGRRILNVKRTITGDGASTLVGTVIAGGDSQRLEESLNSGGVEFLGGPPPPPCRLDGGLHPNDVTTRTSLSMVPHVGLVLMKDAGCF